MLLACWGLGRSAVKKCQFNVRICRTMGDKAVSE
jgi:hypothetical protein